MENSDKKECCENCKYFRDLKIYERKPYARMVPGGIAYGYDIIKYKFRDCKCCVVFINEDPESPVYEADNSNDRCERFKSK